MTLSRYTLRNINTAHVTVPQESLFELPEKVLQFGTGVLLRGLPDYFIDKANRQGVFGGRIVVVKSTSGDASNFEKQDCLYTLCVRGVQNGERIEENTINAAISRVLTATGEWDKVLACAHNAQMQIIISNTTEVGIELVNENIRQHPPKSYPAKLLSFLYERFTAFGGSVHSGMVIIPTELIPDNGTKLLSIVLELAHLNSLEDAFIEWLECCNYFCNSLVDRIVPGKPDAAMQAEIEKVLGYKDGLLTVAEVYRLWAIEGDEHIKSILSFSAVDEGVVIERNIDVYRELKLRMLNGTHTLSCGLAFLAGFDTVKTAMDNKVFSDFITTLMQEEIAPVIPNEINLEMAHTFGTKVLDRFRNPHLQHFWINITMNYSSKMRLRCVPLLIHHYQLTNAVPEAFALGFAGYIYFMKAVAAKEGKWFGTLNGVDYYIQDELAEVFHQRWATLSINEVVAAVTNDVAFWGTDLNAFPSFTESVTNYLHKLINKGLPETLENLIIKKKFRHKATGV